MIFFFKQKTAYELRISDWSSDVCSSDLIAQQLADAFGQNFDYTSVANGPSAVSTTFSGYAGVILSFNASQTAAADSALNYQTFFFEEIGRASCRERVCQYV